MVDLLLLFFTLLLFATTADFDFDMTSGLKMSS